MKRLPLIALLAAALCLASCDWLRHEELPSDVVLLYMAANNSLIYNVEDELVEIADGWLPASGSESQIYLVYLDTGNGPTLKRYSRDESGNVVEETVMTYPKGTDSATKATLAQVLSDAEKAYPADTRGLILWSHGSGYLPSGYYAKPTDTVIPDDQISATSFGQDDSTNSEIDLKDLRTALEPYYFRFIAFDACLMGGVEVVAQLADICDYILASPTETLVYGFCYDKMDEYFFDSEDTRGALVNAATAYYNYFNTSGLDCTIAVYETSAIASLAGVCKDIITSNREKLSAIDRTKVQGFYRGSRPFFYDLESTVKQVCSSSEYEQFRQALGEVVIYKAATPDFLSIEIKEYSGIGTYIPRPEYTNLNAYYKTLAWNKATGLVN